MVEERNVQSLTIPVMVLRVCAVVTLVLGVVLWTGNADGLTVAHVVLGVIFVGALLWLAAANVAVARGSTPLSIVAVVVAAALTVVGFTQGSILASGPHWLIQVTHLALALAAVGMGETIAGRGRRALAAQAA